MTSTRAGTAIAYGDRALAEPLLRGIELVGLPYTWGGRKRYGFGLLPVGEAFLVWSKTAEPWVADVPRPAGTRDLLSDAWLTWWHLASLVLVALLWVAPLYAWYRGSSGS